MTDHAEDIRGPQCHNDEKVTVANPYSGSYAVSVGPNIDLNAFIHNLNARLMDTLGRLDAADKHVQILDAMVVEQGMLLARLPRLVRWLFLR